MNRYSYCGVLIYENGSDDIERYQKEDVKNGRKRVSSCSWRCDSKGTGENAGWRKTVSFGRIL